MELWHGSLTDFVNEARARSLPGTMLQNFWNHHGYAPSTSEIRSWENSLEALADALQGLQARDIGVVLEYHLPYSGYRIDVLLAGKTSNGANCVMALELKQWSDVNLADNSLNVVINGVEHLHPSQQALDYSEHLSEIHSSFSEYSITGASCSFCHNLPDTDETLNGMQFGSLLAQSPLFKKGEEAPLVDFIKNRVGYGDGNYLMGAFIKGRFKPNKRLLDVLDAVVKRDEQWHLLDEQRIAYNAIWGKVVKLKRAGRGARAAVLVRGGPGTGKSVIATQLLADALRLGYTAVHSTGGYAFRTSLQAQFKGADKLFVWNLHMRNAPLQALDLLLVDEAHRIRKTSDTRYTPRDQRSTRSQVEELLDAAKVTVFLLDENQFVRPDEIGCSALVRSETARLGVPLTEYDLAAQFRCGGCSEYGAWVDWLLGFPTDGARDWGDKYSFSVVETPSELEGVIQEAKDHGERARLVAGFCWPWSDPLQDGTLAHDVIIDGWGRPWNAKAGNKKYRPEEHPYTLWAETETGEGQVGCIYSAQGFEFDRVGVIWGPDLVWRNNGWVGQREHSFDSPVKARKADMQHLVRNAYRVLLTRGITETRVLILDPETKGHVKEMLEEVGDVAMEP
jgi:uncharacterized protein